MFDREKFYILCEKFFKNDLVKEVYSTEDYSLCNISNKMYALIVDIDNEYGAAGLFIDSENARRVVEYDDYFYKLIKHIKENNQFQDRLICLNDSSFETILNHKKETDLTGPSEFVDLEFEAELKAKNKSR